MKPNRTTTSRRDTKAEKALSEALHRLQKPDDVHAFLHDLCTPAELQALSDRWQVVRMLTEGKAYRAIQAETGISVTTIGRVARFLNQGAGGYEAALRAFDTQN